MINDLAQDGYAIVSTGLAEEAKRRATAKPFPLLLIETEFLASVIELLGTLRQADALSSIIVVTKHVDLASVVQSIRLRIADVFSNADDDSTILGRARSLLPALPAAWTQLNEQIDRLSGEKQALEERLHALGGEFELWQKTTVAADGGKVERSYDELLREIDASWAALHASRTALQRDEMALATEREELAALRKNLFSQSRSLAAKRARLSEDHLVLLEERSKMEEQRATMATLLSEIEGQLAAS
ncbi:MAG TPA: hypothetical protein VNW30_07225 [Opitutaceae bacterium]|nr:hypothetical protein [Opitutaceae bacterium]